MSNYNTTRERNESIRAKYEFDLKDWRGIFLNVLCITYNVYIVLTVYVPQADAAKKCDVHRGDIRRECIIIK